MKTKRIILGIETSCDDTSLAVLVQDSNKTEILFHQRFGQEASLEKWGGVVPEIAARNHLEKIAPLIEQAFLQSKVSPDQIDIIAVTTVPGLLGPLLTGVNAAKTIALLFEKPLLPVNHLYAHLEAIHLTDRVSYPYLGLLISGGHSIYFWVQDKQNFHVLGSTIDDAAGEAFDKGGKMLNLGYPAGHIVDKLAQFGNPNFIDFPIGLQASADARLSFSGLKTSLRNYLSKNQDITKMRPSQFDSKEESSQQFYDVCASYQNAISKALMLKMRYAIKLAKEKYKASNDFSIVVGGGVACNSEIRKQLTLTYNNVHFVKPEYCTDNGAMIANYALLNPQLAVPFPQCLEVDARGRFIDKKDYVK